MTEADIIAIALARWPLAAEIHVQFHTHVVANRYGSTTEGICICAVEGSSVRKQFTAQTAVDLARRVKDNQADDGFKNNFDSPDGSLIDAAEMLWDSTTPQ